MTPAKIWRCGEGLKQEGMTLPNGAKIRTTPSCGGAPNGEGSESCSKMEMDESKLVDLSPGLLAVTPPGRIDG
jgi:hypothetical protein